MPTSSTRIHPETLGSPETAPGAKRSADHFLEEIRQQTRAGRIRTAQRLVREAVARYPEDPELQKAHGVLVGRRAKSRPGTGRHLREEYAWLRNPPAEYRGRWVALIGAEVIAAADTLEQLRALLSSHVGPTPLAAQIAS